MDATLPGILLTGASGFVGRNFIKAAGGSFRLFCVARRSMEEAGVQPEANLRWIQVDIADRDKLLANSQRLRDHGGIDYVVNLAGYYDFTNQEHPEYVRTNVWGTRNMLDLAKELHVKRFIFASSQAACRFGVTVDEQTAPDAPIPYARSKRKGEELIHEYAQWVPGAIVRIAAVFSDWCEYPPLYTMLNNWCSGKVLESHILAGRGRSAIPYIHVHDLVQLFLRILDKSNELEKICVFNGGPDGAVSHLELFNVATQFYYNAPRKPFFTPRWLLKPMVLARYVLCHLQGKEPFERLWMLDYIDQQLVADSARTRDQLDWKVTPRKTIIRRLVFLVENMKKNPELWRSWNEAMLVKTAYRPQLLLHDRLCEALTNARDDMVDAITTQLTTRSATAPAMAARDIGPDRETAGAATDLQAVSSTVARSHVKLLYQLIVTVLRTRNRPMMQQYAHTISFLPLSSGFTNKLISHSLFVMGEHLIEQFRSHFEFKKQTVKADDYITMTIHMAIDQIEDQIELARRQSPLLREELRKTPPPADNRRLEAVIVQLEELCNDAMAAHSWTSPMIRE
ncbi:MAG: NAD(P)-dependent oxidoreductase [Desulfobulbus oligotrophicus]|nr:NAD(P)-dependent oxidoreductase [Desulfobulbus oligotrophicus]